MQCEVRVWQAEVCGRVVVVWCGEAVQKRRGCQNGECRNVCAVCVR